MTKKIYKGNIVNPTSINQLDVFEHAYITVEDEIIQSITKEIEEDDDVVDYGDALIIPAFTDLHIHASQYVERGVGMDCLLFDWLNKYTFPQESKFQDTAYAKQIYAQVIRDMLMHGTMHASIFTTIHYDACNILFELLEKSGMYAFTGKVNMNQNSPDYYVETTEESLQQTERFVKEHLDGYSGRVKPILTPRFAPTCSEELLKGLGEITKKYNVGLQTHLVESKEEAAWAKELFPQYASDGEIYEACGLLEGNGPKIFAHVIFPTEVEKRILKQYDCISVHCPDATTNITAGIMPVHSLLEDGYNLAMGSDVGGGHFIGIYREICRTVQLAKLKEFYEEDHKRITFANAFYMATAGGGKAFGNVGKLEKGYRFDALVIDGLQDEGYEITPLECLERFCYSGDERNIKTRYLDGSEINPEDIYKQLNI